MNNLRGWFYHHIYCSHPAQYVVNCGEEWDWGCYRCEQMLSGTGPQTLLSKLQSVLFRFDAILARHHEDDDLPF